MPADQGGPAADLSAVDVLHPRPDAVAALKDGSCLDADQAEAILACLSQELTCVQGPPGTGHALPAAQQLLWLEHMSCVLSPQKASSQHFCAAQPCACCAAVISQARAALPERLPHACCCLDGGQDDQSQPMRCPAS